MTEIEPDGYVAAIAELKARVREARSAAQRVVNVELIRLYWSIGRVILERQSAEAWGSRVIARLADDLRTEFPEMRGFSRANLFYMRAFAAAWPTESAVVQQPVGRLPWGHIIDLLDKLDDQQHRDWYAAAAAEHGWSRAILLNQIKSGAHARLGAAPSNFAGLFERSDSELAQQLTKDPYVLDFLALDGDAAERQTHPLWVSCCAPTRTPPSCATRSLEAPHPSQSPAMTCSHPTPAPLCRPKSRSPERSSPEAATD